MRLAITIILALSIGACGKATDEDYDDIATGIAALTAEGSGGEAESLKEGTQLSKGVMPMGFTRDAMGTITGKRGRLDYSLTVTCTDTMGSIQTACDETTDSARLVLHWTGEIDGPRLDATLDRTGDWRVTGIQSGEAEFNGTGTFDVDAEFTAFYRPVMKTFVLDYDAQYESVKVRLSDRAILSGTARYQVHAIKTTTRRTRTAERELDVTATVTFDGENGAQIELDGERFYKLNLVTGLVTRSAKQL